MAEDFVEILEGKTIDDKYIHVYKGLKTGLLHVGVERAVGKAVETTGK